MNRIKVIFKCFYHGFMPYWFYESEKHYDCSYFEHLKINIIYAFRWLSFNETEDDINFEKNK